MSDNQLDPRLTKREKSAVVWRPEVAEKGAWNGSIKERSNYMQAEVNMPAEDGSGVDIQFSLDQPIREEDKVPAWAAPSQLSQGIVGPENLHTPGVTISSNRGTVMLTWEQFFALQDAVDQALDAAIEQHNRPNAAPSKASIAKAKAANTKTAVDPIKGSGK